MKKVAILLFACSFIAACEKDPQPEAESAVITNTISGTIKFRERIGLTRNSQLEVQLLDTSIADMPAKPIAHKIVDDPGQAPFDFTIDYDPAVIVERNTYSVSAKIRDGGKLILVSHTANPVLTHGAPSIVTVEMVRVGTVVPTETETQ